MFKRSRTKAATSRKARRMDWGAAQAQVRLFGTQCSATYVLLPTDVRTFFTDPTLIRTLMFTSMRNTTADPSPFNGGTAAVGLIAWDDINDTPDDVPCPISDANLDWIIRHVHPIPPGELVETYTSFPQTDMIFQSKAMRRLGNTKGLLLSFEVVGSGALNYAFATDVRFLIKE